MEKRKPDKETESFRMWEADKKKNPKEFEEFKKADEGAINIEYKGIKIKMLGFNKCLDKETNRLVFAYKFKHKERLILIHNPSKNVKMEDLLRTLANVIGYEVKNSEEIIKNLYNEMPSKDLNKQGEKND